MEAPAVEEEAEPNDADLAFCASILRRLRPGDLEEERCKDLLEAGAPLFRRHILREKFGSSEVVTFLREKVRINKKLAQLERLNSVIQDEHEVRRKRAEECGLNLKRKEGLAAIKKESELPIAAALQLEAGEAIADGSAAEEQPLQEDAAEGLALGEEVPPSDGAGQVQVGGSLASGALPPRSDFYSQCNMCRGEYIEHHHFYHQLCPRCAELNWEKRHQTSDMHGMVCVVTGGRVRIGYHTVLKLLRAGAFVLTTTRFPCDCALRYSREPDFDEWRDRLEVCGPLELSDMRLVEHFCEALARRFPRVHVLINNAAQTLTRRQGWAVRMVELEQVAAATLPPAARQLLRAAPERGGVWALQDGAEQAEPPVEDDAEPVEVREDLVQAPEEATGALAVRTAPPAEALDGSQDRLWVDAVELKDFPRGELDESRQPLDLSARNSWSRRLGDISTLELLQTLAANTAAPFIMCSRLASVLAPPPGTTDPYGHIINVSALEGKFSVKNKSHGHPHTNMAKAALNMLTHTSASELFQRRVLMNCVDTGWVTDMAPGGRGVVAATHATYVGPPLDEEDGAARVLDPVFQHLNDPTWLLRGRFFKNYYVAGW